MYNKIKNDNIKLLKSFSKERKKREFIGNLDIRNKLKNKLIKKTANNFEYLKNPQNNNLNIKDKNNNSNEELLNFSFNNLRNLNSNQITDKNNSNNLNDSSYNRMNLDSSDLEKKLSLENNTVLKKISDIKFNYINLNSDSKENLNFEFKEFSKEKNYDNNIILETNSNKEITNDIKDTSDFGENIQNKIDINKNITKINDNMPNDIFEFDKINKLEFNKINNPNIEESNKNLNEKLHVYKNSNDIKNNSEFIPNIDEFNKNLNEKLQDYKNSNDIKNKLDNIININLEQKLEKIDNWKKIKDDSKNFVSKIGFIVKKSEFNYFYEILKINFLNYKVDNFINFINILDKKIYFQKFFINLDLIKKDQIYSYNLYVSILKKIYYNKIKEHCIQQKNWVKLAHKEIKKPTVFYILKKNLYIQRTSKLFYNFLKLKFFNQLKIFSTNFKEDQEVNRLILNNFCSKQYFKKIFSMIRVFIIFKKRKTLNKKRSILFRNAKLKEKFFKLWKDKLNKKYYGNFNSNNNYITYTIKKSVKLNLNSLKQHNKLIDKKIIINNK